MKEEQCDQREQSTSECRRKSSPSSSPLTTPRCSPSRSNGSSSQESQQPDLWTCWGKWGSFRHPHQRKHLLHLGVALISEHQSFPPQRPQLLPPPLHRHLRNLKKQEREKKKTDMLQGFSKGSKCKGIRKAMLACGKFHVSLLYRAARAKHSLPSLR